MAKQDSNKLIYSLHGMDIYLNHKPAKKTGKDHLWIQVRQKGKKKWQVYTALAYRNSVDLHFIKE